MYLLINLNGIITLQTGGDLDNRLAIIGHRNSYQGYQALQQKDIPIITA